ncbi:hypothetical protein SBOR_7701 [Sclerotinia borealis F-4128]|uniref:Uncharacterized protein n=1 Tax=Sclerotinia borealis (strain F-4128) TaxID=1432307 RepID=W9C583_SCLBF|nr:hypothetical protein SBOR_7701 [Sclerotinia borealis F-4128]
MPTSRQLFLFSIAGTWLLVHYLISGVYGRLTLESVRNLTGVTKECRGRIEWSGVAGSDDFVGREEDTGGRRELELNEGRREGGGNEQVFMGGEDSDEIEDTITAALRILCSDLLIELEKPLMSDLDLSSPGNTLTKTDCTKVKKDFDEFLKETTWFLYEIQERQMKWRWGGGSAVKGGLEWLQGLWASREGNSQDRSFIEQQMGLYRDTRCFGGKLNKEVLRKDIEVVEYLNDLIDMFW